MSHAVILRVFELVGEKNIELMAYSLTFSNFRLFTFAFGETDKKYWNEKDFFVHRKPPWDTKMLQQTGHDV